MNSNVIKLVPVKDLLGLRFVIPEYQRGYKWTKKQAEDLLGDLYEFQQEQDHINDFYCLQPLVVRRSSQSLPDQIRIEPSDSEETVHKKVKVAFNSNVLWEVIDGQQRLTTIYLLLSYFIRQGIGQSIPGLYGLSFTTRDESHDYLKSFADADEEWKKYRDKYVDFYHMANVFDAIGKWFEGQGGIDAGMKLMDTILNRTQFIWYETTETNPIEVFTRLNVGKISLTNSELIKALLLSHFSSGTQDVIRQHEIANEWNDIEQKLQNDELWYFVHSADYKEPTRIDYLFDIECQLYMDSLDKKLQHEHITRIGTDMYRTFRHYDWILKKDHAAGNCVFEEQWRKIKHLFSVISEWYTDNLCYHYIGFILNHAPVDIVELYKQWNKSSKSSFIDDVLKVKIREVILNCKKGDKDILEQQYEIESDGEVISKSICRPILLLHNIQTAINQNRQAQSEDQFKHPVFYRFPFYRYKTEDWDVEHIDSNVTNDLSNNFTKLLALLQYSETKLSGDVERRIKSVIRDVIDFLKKHVGKEDMRLEEDQIRARLKEYRFNDFDQLVESINKSRSPLDTEKKNQIGNFTLLDASTNRGYGNSIFPTKRMTIMAKDRGMKYRLCMVKEKGKQWHFHDELEKDTKIGSFIPPVTRNVFMKYYAPKAASFAAWDEEDFEAYRTDIRQLLGEFLNNPSK